MNSRTVVATPAAKAARGQALGAVVVGLQRTVMDERAIAVRIFATIDRVCRAFFEEGRRGRRRSGSRCYNSMSKCRRRQASSAPRCSATMRRATTSTCSRPPRASLGNAVRRARQPLQEPNPVVPATAPRTSSPRDGARARLGTCCRARRRARHSAPRRHRPRRRPKALGSRAGTPRACSRSGATAFCTWGAPSASVRYLARRRPARGEVDGSSAVPRSTSPHPWGATTGHVGGGRDGGAALRDDARGGGVRRSG